MRTPIVWKVVLWLYVAIHLGSRETASAGEPTYKDIPYAVAAGTELKLDLYLPQRPAKPGLLVWVHGGAWRGGSKSSMPLEPLVAEGHAIASVDYRLSTTARFPAQVHDLKAAIRFIRAKQRSYGYDAERIVIAGASAGGHLAALVGVTNGHAELEGKVGEHLAERSDVQAIISFYGMSNLTTILSQSTPHGLQVRVPALELLLGGRPEEKSELAKLASPVFHVDATDPPLLMLHGDQDPQAPINQSLELQGCYEAAKAPCQLIVVHGAGHGGAEFFDETQRERVKAFLAERQK